MLYSECDWLKSPLPDIFHTTEFSTQDLVTFVLHVGNDIPNGVKYVNGRVVVRNMHLTANMACDSEQCCRICAQKNKTVISLYSEEGLLRQLISKLKYCLQINVLENDSLPTNLCWKCLTKLEVCFELMQERLKGQHEFTRQMLLRESAQLTWNNFEVKMDEPESLNESSNTPKKRKVNTFKHTDNVVPCPCQECDMNTGIHYTTIQVKPEDPTEHPAARIEAAASHKEEAFSNTQGMSTSFHQANCHCEQCVPLSQHMVMQMKEQPSRPTEKTEVTLSHEDQARTFQQPSSHETTCQCEQCISRYGSLPVLAEVVHMSDSVSPVKVNQQLSSVPETSNVSKQPVSEASGSTRISKKTICCDFCNKVFSHTGDLNKHRRKHTGERPYPCHQCNKRFSHASNLLRHQKIHSGDKPHQCHFCAKKFSRKDKMVNHMKNSHNNSTECQ